MWIIPLFQTVNRYFCRTLWSVECFCYWLFCSFYLVECASSSDVSLTAVAGCLANFHSLFLIMVWFVFIQSEARSFIREQSCIVAGFAEENWAGGTVSHGTLPEETAETGVGSTQETYGFRKEDIIMHGSSLQHSLLLLQCARSSWHKKKNSSKLLLLCSYFLCSRCHGLGNTRLKKQHIRLWLLSSRDSFYWLVAALFHLPTALQHYISLEYSFHWWAQWQINLFL